jgi:hypothetical protein
MDGSALDLVPLRGSPMRQLVERVQAVEPGARMLVEGDHLHVSFPDWQGARLLLVGRRRLGCAIRCGEPLCLIATYVPLQQIEVFDDSDSTITRFLSMF